MALDILIHHMGDPDAALALAERLRPDLRAGERITARASVVVAGLDPAVPEPGDVRWPISAGADAPDVVVLLDARSLAPEPGFLQGLRRAPREWDAWTGPLLTTNGAAVATAGLGLTLLAATVPLRRGMPVARLPQTPFLTDALPPPLIAVRRRVSDGMHGLLATRDPRALALMLALGLRAAGERAGVAPAARARLRPGAPAPWAPTPSAARVRAAVAAYPTGVLAAAAPAAALAVSVGLVRSMARGAGRPALERVAEAAGALPAAIRDRPAGAPIRAVGGATFGDGIVADGPAGTATGMLAGAWWGAAAGVMRAGRARARRRAARSTPTA